MLLVMLKHRCVSWVFGANQFVASAPEVSPLKKLSAVQKETLVQFFQSRFDLFQRCVAVLAHRLHLSIPVRQVAPSVVRFPKEEPDKPDAWGALSGLLSGSVRFVRFDMSKPLFLLNMAKLTQPDATVRFLPFAGLASCQASGLPHSIISSTYGPRPSTNLTPCGRGHDLQSGPSRPSAMLHEGWTR